MTDDISALHDGCSRHSNDLIPYWPGDQGPRLADCSKCSQGSRGEAWPVPSVVLAMRSWPYQDYAGDGGGRGGGGGGGFMILDQEPQTGPWDSGKGSVCNRCIKKKAARHGGSQQRQTWPERLGLEPSGNLFSCNDGFLWRCRGKRLEKSIRSKRSAQRLNKISKKLIEIPNLGVFVN